VSTEVLHTKFNIVKRDRLAGPHIQVIYAHGYVFQMVNETKHITMKKGMVPQMSMHMSATEGL